MFIPSKAELYAYYRSTAVRERFTTFQQQRRVSVIREAIQRFAPPNPTILDLGCGDGYGSGLALNGIKGVRYIGIDYSMSKLKDCKLQVEGRVDGVLADAEMLPVGRDMVDLVLLCETIEHLPSPHQALTEIQRVLKPHGRLIITIPLCGWLQEPLVKLYHMLKRKQEVFAEHLYFFTRGAALDLLRQQKFEVLYEQRCSFVLPFNLNPGTYETYERLDRWLGVLRVGLTGKPERWQLGQMIMVLVCAR
jgi:ubiquinone/menaquinone biosynthesis C-methylase UbiE